MQRKTKLNLALRGFLETCLSLQRNIVGPWSRDLYDGLKSKNLQLKH